MRRKHGFYEYLTSLCWQSTDIVDGSAQFRFLLLPLLWSERGVMEIREIPDFTWKMFGSDYHVGNVWQQQQSNPVERDQHDWL
jgi:hypothetical protein